MTHPRCLPRLTDAQLCERLAGDRRRRFRIEFMCYDCGESKKTLKGYCPKCLRPTRGEEIVRERSDP